MSNYGKYQEHVEHIQECLDGQGIQCWIDYALAQAHKLNPAMPEAEAIRKFKAFFPNSPEGDIIHTVELAYCSYEGILGIWVNGDSDCYCEPDGLVFENDEEADQFNKRILEIWEELLTC